MVPMLLFLAPSWGCHFITFIPLILILKNHREEIQIGQSELTGGPGGPGVPESPLVPTAPCGEERKARRSVSVMPTY